MGFKKALHVPNWLSLAQIYHIGMGLKFATLCRSEDRTGALAMRHRVGPNRIIKHRLWLLGQQGGGAIRLFGVLAGEGADGQHRLVYCLPEAGTAVQPFG